MQVDVTQVIMDHEGEPFLSSPKLVMLADGRMAENPDSKPLTLRKALLAALNSSADKLPLNKQLARHRLGKRIAKEDSPDLTATQVASLRKACADKFSPFLTGCIADLLEPGQAESATDEEF